MLHSVRMSVGEEEEEEDKRRGENMCLCRLRGGQLKRKHAERERRRNKILGLKYAGCNTRAGLLICGRVGNESSPEPAWCGQRELPEAVQLGKK